ncbi:MAG: glycosyltransferase [Candidatus Aenigmarchaeota archaeon]|nr:glycosyltransferase [Candidatus Aenigmarchaeota archaeon]
MKNSETYTVSLLIPAYNEKENIRELLNRLLKQKIDDFILKEIVVIASGCTDGTEKIVKEFDESKVRLLVQPTRDGKAPAINFFLKNASTDIVIIQSADTLPVDDYTINNLLKPFRNEKTGLTAGRPIPLNNSRKFTTLINSSLWHLHHRVSSGCPPKVGEIIAFRNIIQTIPEKTAADEESISALIQQKGYEAVYVPDAVVCNKGPEKISELIKQRKRISIGHLWIKKNQNYIVPSMNILRLARVLIDEIIENPKKLLTLTPLIILEVIIRLSAAYDFYIRKRNDYIWERIGSTKKLA